MRFIPSWQPGRVVAAAALWALVAATAVTAQDTAQTIAGVVIDANAGTGIEGVAVVVDGTDITAVSQANGGFTLRGLEAGTWVLVANRLGYAEARYDFTIDGQSTVTLELRMSQQAVELDPFLIETQSDEQLTARARGSSRNVVTREEIETALGVSRHLGDLIGKTVPGVRVRRSNNLAGTDLCLEFRGAAETSLFANASCHHPLLLIDGIPVSNPNFAYGTIPLNTIEQIRIVPPGEAGARYGNGSQYGVLLVETRDPRSGWVAAADDEPDFYTGTSTFDWSQDPEGHSGLRTAGAAFAGTTLGLGAGLLVARRCFAIDEMREIEASCGRAGNTAAAISALAIPALTGAIGGRLGGGTDGSVGRFGPALVGATMALLPGYVYSLSTVGAGSRTTNIVGAVLLLVGTPLAVTISDNLFRDLRGGPARLR